MDGMRLNYKYYAFSKKVCTCNSFLICTRHCLNTFKALNW